MVRKKEHGYEQGSDYHFLTNLPVGSNSFLNAYAFNHYANGRQAITSLIRYNNWKRIWLPEYFCYDVVKVIKDTPIDVVFYPDGPQLNDIKIISEINFKHGDVLLRMNFFGLRGFRDNQNIPIPVIEDHSHDLIGEWAKNSKADWCICSLRKSLPLPEGGILWSPKGYKLPPSPSRTVENDILSLKRINAMLLKTLYLNELNINKEDFRKLYIETESEFDSLPLSEMSSESLSILSKIDVEIFLQNKKSNWEVLYSLLSDKIEVLIPESKNCYPFSFILKLKNEIERENLRAKLINSMIYPAILWSIPVGQSDYIRNISNSLLSIHCDARYNKKEIDLLANKIISLL